MGSNFGHVLDHFVVCRLLVVEESTAPSFSVVCNFSEDGEGALFGSCDPPHTGNVISSSIISGSIISAQPAALAFLGLSNNECGLHFFLDNLVSIR